MLILFLEVSTFKLVKGMIHEMIRFLESIKWFVNQKKIVCQLLIIDSSFYYLFCEFQLLKYNDLLFFVIYDGK